MSLSRVLLLSILALPLQAIVVTGPELPVSQTVYAAPYGSQAKPAVASDGDGYMAIWSDLSDERHGVFGARIGSDGEVLTRPSMRLATDGQAFGLNLVWNGSSYLAAWQGYSQSVFVMRVDRDGTPLDEPHVVAPAAAIRNGSLAWNGRNFLLVCAGIDDRLTHAVLLDAAGAVTRRIDLPSVTSQTGLLAAVALGDTFYVFYNTFQLDLATGGRIANILATRVSASGDTERLREVATVPEEEFNFGLATNGSTISLVGLEKSGHPLLHAFAIDASLRTTVFPPVEIGNDAIDVGVASNGSTFLTYWITGKAVMTMPLDAAGAPSASGQRGSDAALFTPAVASNGRTWMAAWHDRRQSDSGDIFGTLLDPSARPTMSDELISITARKQGRPAVAGSVVVWVETLTDKGQSELWAARVGGSAVRLSTSQRQATPSIVATGSGYLAVWAEGTLFDSNLTIVSRRLGADGQPLDVAPLVLSDATAWQGTSIAFDGSNAFVVWTDSRVVIGRRLNTSNTPLDAAPFVIGTGYLPQVATNGSEFLVVWTVGSNWWQFPSPGLRDVLAARVSPSGLVIDSTPIEIAAGPDDQSALSVASDGKDFAVGYADDNQFNGVNGYVRPVHANGTLAEAGIVVQSVVTMSIARRGDKYVVASVTRENYQPALHLATFDGAVSDDRVVATSIAGAEIALTGSLFVYSRFADELPYAGAWRVFVRLLGDGGRGRVIR